jgi:hypothetical protein
MVFAICGPLLAGNTTAAEAPGTDERKARCSEPDCTCVPVGTGAPVCGRPLDNGKLAVGSCCSGDKSAARPARDEGALLAKNCCLGRGAGHECTAPETIEECYPKFASAESDPSTDNELKNAATLHFDGHFEDPPDKIPILLP